MRREHSSEEIRKYVLDKITDHPRTLSSRVSKEFKISRQAVYRHLAKLKKEGLIQIQGRTRNRAYYLKPIEEREINIKLAPDLQEDVIWRENYASFFADIKSNIRDICHYGFTEMVNNVIDHSEADMLTTKFEYNIKQLKIWIYDNGIGIFNKITNDLELDDNRHAILELCKGKLTTDPDRHTGEGIFFTSRMFDIFSILSGDLFFAYYQDNDWLIENKSNILRGTTISMKLDLDTNRTVKEILDKYALEEEDFGFTRTRFPVALAAYGEESLVSRSQARRLLARFERFKEVCLDFSKIEFIGQAFADEIFRVYQNENPSIRIIWMCANDDVEKMISRILAGQDKDQLKINLNMQ